MGRRSLFMRCCISCCRSARPSCVVMRAPQDLLRFAAPLCATGSSRCSMWPISSGARRSRLSSQAHAVGPAVRARSEADFPALLRGERIEPGGDLRQIVHALEHAEVHLRARSAPCRRRRAPCSSRAKWRPRDTAAGRAKAAAVPARNSYPHPAGPPPNRRTSSTSRRARPSAIPIGKCGCPAARAHCAAAPRLPSARGRRRCTPAAPRGASARRLLRRVLHRLARGIEQLVERLRDGVGVVVRRALQLVVRMLRGDRFAQLGALILQPLHQLP